MYFSAFFKQNDSPKIGITPSITLYRLSDSNLIINAVSMTELGTGIYIYDFTAYDRDQDYIGVVDAGTSDVDIRYKVLGTASYKDDFIEGLLAKKIQEAGLLTIQTLFACIVKMGIMTPPSSDPGTGTEIFTDSGQNALAEMIFNTDVRGHITSKIMANMASENYDSVSISEHVTLSIV